MKSFSELVEMYALWCTQMDENIRQSDIICECYDSGFSYDDVEKAGSQKADEMLNDLFSC